MCTCSNKTTVKTYNVQIVFLIWIFVINTSESASEIIKSNNSDVTLRQQRMFDNFYRRESTESDHKEESNHENHDYEWTEQEDNKNAAGSPKFMSEMMSLQPSNHKYPDYMEKEYDTYSPPDEYYPHDYMPSSSHGPPMYSMIVRQEQSLTSKLSNLISMDTMKILLILLLKMMLIKLKALGFMKMLLLLLIKLPVLLFGFLTKIIIIAKLANILKIITLPLLLPLILLLLAPLLIPLLLPLLLLPLLLPLLLFLPIPVITITTTTTTTTTVTPPNGRRRRRRNIEGSDSDLRLGLQSFRQQYGRSSYYNDMVFLKYVAESEQCLERIACKLAADERSSPFKSYVIRILDIAKRYLENSKFHSYVSAYKFGATMNSSFEKCVKYYRCSKFKT